MPERETCLHCRKLIDKESDDYVIANKHTKGRYDDSLYVHVMCYDEWLAANAPPSLSK